MVNFHTFLYYYIVLYRHLSYFIVFCIISILFSCLYYIIFINIALSYNLVRVTYPFKHLRIHTHIYTYIQTPPAHTTTHWSCSATTSTSFESLHIHIFTQVSNSYKRILSKSKYSTAISYMSSDAGPPKTQNNFSTKKKSQ